MKKDLKVLITVHSLVILSFGVVYLSARNYEFLIYLAAILGLTALVWFSRKKIHYSMSLLWALVIWTFLHLAGGIVPVGEGVLYGWMVWPLSDTYPILRFDQLVHAYGFGTTAFLVYALLKPFTKTKAKDSIALSIVIVMGAAGFGALNEALEFLAVVLAPRTGVGGYINTSLDSVFNFLGALIAIVIIRRKAL